MTNFRDMYFKLAARVADAIELLSEAQRQGEESYVSSEDAPPIEIVNNKDLKTPTD